MQCSICVANQIGLLASIEIASAGAQHEIGIECVNSALLGPDFATTLTWQIGDVDADLTCGWVGPSVESYHDICSVWNASYRLDSDGS